MAFHEEFADLMADEVTIEPFSTEDRNAQASYGTGVVYACRVVGQRKWVRGFQGQELLSTVQIYLNSTASIHPRSRVTLPSRFSPLRPPIIYVKLESDETGAAYTAIYC